MTTKEDFNAVEWQHVVEAPALAGLIVVASQRGGTVRESVAMAKAYIAAEQKHSGHPVLGDIVATAPEVSAREFGSVEELRTQGLQRIGDAVALLEGKLTAEELDAYKQFTVTVATAAAEADKSGGFLGIGGERVTDVERAALAQIREALGLEAEPPA
jgi:hypothetical protein